MDGCHKECLHFLTDKVKTHIQQDHSYTISTRQNWEDIDRHITRTETRKQTYNIREPEITALERSVAKQQRLQARLKFTDRCTDREKDGQV